MIELIISLALAAILLLFVVFGLLWGLKRGLKKTLFRAAWLAVTAVLLFAFTPMITRAVMNADLSALSWAAYDNDMSLDAIRHKFEEIVAKPKMNPWFVLFMAALANASFCRLFGGDIWAMLIVFTSTLVGFFTRQHLTRRGVNHYIVFIVSAFVASLCASSALALGLNTAEIALATSVLYLVPGVPLINGVIDITDGHIQIGISRLVNALMLIVCIAIGMSATLMLVKDSLL